MQAKHFIDLWWGSLSFPPIFTYTNPSEMKVGGVQLTLLRLCKSNQETLLLKGLIGSRKGNQMLETWNKSLGFSHTVKR